jgi:secondary thiamine-phosphate synthase enzyme
VISVVTPDPVEFVDITPTLARFVESVGLCEGLLTVYTRHTTTGLLINEHEPLLFADLHAMFERLVPKDGPFAHDDFERRTVNLTPGERRNGWAHCRASLLRTSESIPVADAQPCLGRWQRVLVVEFDGGQRREIAVTLRGAFRADAHPSFAGSQNGDPSRPFVIFLSHDLVEEVTSTLKSRPGGPWGPGGPGGHGGPGLPGSPLVDRRAANAWSADIAR